MNTLIVYRDCSYIIETEINHIFIILFENALTFLDDFPSVRYWNWYFGVYLKVWKFFPGSFTYVLLIVISNSFSSVVVISHQTLMLNFQEFKFTVRSSQSLVRFVYFSANLLETCLICYRCLLLNPSLTSSRFRHKYILESRSVYTSIYTNKYV